MFRDREERISCHGATLCARVALALLLLRLALPAQAQAFFQELPTDTYADAWGLSADGSTVVGQTLRPFCGYCCYENNISQEGYEEWIFASGGLFPKGFKWTDPGPALELEYLSGSCAAIPAGCTGHCFGYAIAVSSDGSVVVGQSRSFEDALACRWISGTPEPLAGVPPDFIFSSASGVSGAGSEVVGTGYVAGIDGTHAFWWQAPDTFVLLPEGGALSSSAWGISENGLVVVGGLSVFFPSPPCVWELDTITGTWSLTALPELPPLPGGGPSAVWGISRDGTVAVGESAYQACYWKKNVSTGVWDPPVGIAGGPTPVFSSYAYAANRDGSVIVGESWRAFIWDATNGTRPLKDVLSSFGVGPPAGWELHYATGVSADGQTFAGSGVNPFGVWRAWRARLGNTGPGTSVPVDVNGGSGTPGGVTVTFGDVTTGGETTADPTTGCAPPPAGSANFKVLNPPVCYNIESTASYTGMITVCINYSGTAADTGTSAEETLELRHYEPTGCPPPHWCDRTVDASPGDPTTLVDTVNNIICAEVSSLSPFMIVERDADGDALTDAEELALGTDPQNPDTDGDGLLDGTEVEMAAGSGCPNPLDADSDNDGLTDGAEVAAGTNPCNPDTDADGVPDNTDPLPTQPGVTSGWLEDATRYLATTVIPALDLGLFNGPNTNANKGRRNALANRAGEAANLIAASSYPGAIDELTSLLEKIDDATPPPDWMAPSPEKTALADEVRLLIELLEYLVP